LWWASRLRCSRCWVPVGVRTTLASARRAVVDGHYAAVERLSADIRELVSTGDAAEGVRSFVEKRSARFTGR
jgi:enoyl-CoA hydratase